MTPHDPALSALWLPFTEGHIPAPTSTERGLFMHARGPLPNHALAFDCVQSFKPFADALQQQGASVTPTLPTTKTTQYPVVAVLPPRQRDEARSLLAQALLQVRAGGYLVLAAANDEGARTHEADLRSLSGNVNQLSKHKCRVCWVQVRPDTLNHTLLQNWLALDAIRTLEVPFQQQRWSWQSRPGLFAWDRIDIASSLLAEQLATHLNATQVGTAADLGAGQGYLSRVLMHCCPQLQQLDAYEAEYRAVELAQHNLQSHPSQPTRPITSNQAQVHWHDVTQGLHQRYDLIVTNPPFHEQASHRPDIGQQFIRVAAQHLQPSGQLWLVANRHLPYESILTDNFSQVRVAATAHGFKIIHATKIAAAKPAPTQAGMKLLKYVANLGYGSRKQVAQLFAEGRITDASGAPLNETSYLAHEQIRIDGIALDPAPNSLLMLHKPIGYTCSTQDHGALIYDLLPPRFRLRSPLIAPVGRLDRDTSGLLLLTDDGQLLHRITSPKHKLPKVYEVTLDRELRGDEAALFASGTLMLNGEREPLLPAQLQVVDAHHAQLTITEGRYHQVRRMFAAVGNHVVALHRAQIGGLALGTLATGQWQLLDDAQRQQLLT